MVLSVNALWPHCLLFTAATDTAELHLSGIIGTENHSDMQKIRIIVFFFDSYIGSLQFGCYYFSMYLRLNLPSTPDLFGSRSHNTVLYLIR